MPDAQMSFVCGSNSVPWDSVSRVSHAIQQYRWGIERTFALLQAGYGYINMDFPVTVVRASAAEAERPLLKQLWHFKGRKCGDPRDKVFAILRICKDLESGDVAVDYSASVARVYSEVSKFIVLRDRSLKLLSACQSYGSDITDLPSWAPDWSIYERYRPTRPISSWTADGQSDIFNASGSFPARVDISTDLRTIRAQGHCVGKLSALGTHLGNDGDTEETPDTQKSMFTLFQTRWRLARTPTPDFTPSGERRFDAFWRTIITDMNSFCQKATQSEEGTQFRPWMAVPSTAFEPEDLVAGNLVQENLSFVASFQQATRNRRLFVTEEGHMIGPAVDEARRSGVHVAGVTSAVHFASSR